MAWPRPRAIVAFAATVALVAACQVSTASSAPSDGRSPAATSSAASSGSPVISTQSPATPSATPVAVQARWEPAGTMGIDRAGGAGMHAVLLGDGRVLVVGGGAGGGDVTDDSAKAELWDPATGDWSPTESLNKPRGAFAAVPLADGRALVTGGFNQENQSYSSTYLYDPSAGTWSKSGLLGMARTSPAAATLPDGRVLVAGGYFRTKPTGGAVPAPGVVLAAYRAPAAPGAAGPRFDDIEPPHVGAAVATAELFDPATGEWKATGPLNFARYGAAAVTLADGRILVAGSGSSSDGVTVDDRAVNSAEIYDPVSGKFTLVGGLPPIDRAALQKQGVPKANPVPDDDPLIANGGTLLALNDGGAALIAQAGWWKHVGDITRSFRFAGSWSEIGETYVYIGEPTEVPLVTRGVPSLAGAMAARLSDGRVLVAGGAGAIPEGSPYSTVYTTDVARLYDPATDTWSALPPMPEPRAGAVPVVLADGSVLLVGGYDDREDTRVDLNSAIRFVPAS